MKVQIKLLKGGMKMKQKNKKIIIAITCVSILFFSLFFLLYNMGSPKNLKYLELTENNEIRLKPCYLDIEELFGVKRLTKEEIEKIKSFTANKQISTEDYVVFAHLYNNDELFENEEAFNKRAEEVKSLTNQSLEEIKNNYYQTSSYGEYLIKAKLTEKKELPATNFKIQNKFMFKNVTGIAPFGFSGATIDTMQLGNKIEKIGEKAFFSAKIRDLTLGENTLEIGSNVFMNCETIEMVHSVRFLEEFKIAEDNFVFSNVYMLET